MTFTYTLVDSDGVIVRATESFAHAVEIQRAFAEHGINLELNKL